MSPLSLKIAPWILQTGLLAFYCVVSTCQILHTIPSGLSSTILDDDHFIHNYFLPQEYAIIIHVLAGVALVCFLCVFIGSVMLKSKRKKA
ncbi:Dolichol-phosphate mannose synthase subunit 2 [Bienertia sinuspersici]